MAKGRLGGALHGGGGRWRLARLVAGAASGAMAACSSPALTSDEARARLAEHRGLLAAARAQWTAAAPGEYELVQARLCECAPEWMRASRVVVRRPAPGVGAAGELIVSVADTEPGAPVSAERAGAVRGVAGLFAVVEDAIAREAAQLVVTYDPAYGYPTRIYIDYRADVADDELLLTASRLQPLR